MHKILSFFKKNKKSCLFTELDEDVEISNILIDEKERQLTSLELIASENFTSLSVLQANGTIFTNKYSEGYPGKRYYGGNENIDKLEKLCIKRALKAFSLDKKEWDANVQSYSGSIANFSVYGALLEPGQKIMGLDLPSGGHLTHGYFTDNRKISNSAIYFNSKPYKVGNDFLIDYRELERLVDDFKPKLIIVGASSYPRDFDYKKFRYIADKHFSYLVADIAHTSGLIASNLLNNPFEYCDVVTTTTHKTLRGPRGAIIFYRNKFKQQIDFSVFPSTQGGPHNNTIAAIATALKQVDTEEFKEYSRQIIKNSKYLSKLLIKKDFDVITGGTDNHIILLNLKNKKITGSKFEKIAELCNVSVNKNTIATDKSALNPSGIRIGTSAMTSRGFIEKDFLFVAEVINDITELTIRICEKINSSKLVHFIREINTTYIKDIEEINDRVSNYCKQFKLPGL